jgi:hypothetical protein
MTSTNLPPDGHFMQLLMGKVTTYTLSAVARLGIADYMDVEPQPVASIAAASGVKADMLYRVLRLLASVGVVSQQGDAFGLTPVGELLRSDAPHSLRHIATMMGDPWTTDSYQRIYQTLQTGTDGVTLAYGKHAFALFEQDVEQGANFHAAMTSFTRSMVGALLESFDFSGIAKLADVGGGHGILLASVLGRYPSMQGVLFDLPEVLAGAGAHDRMALQAGSFFDTVPEGCDAYLMKHIIHDWDDGSCRRILSLMREKMAPGGRVLLFEMVVPPGTDPVPAKFLDIEMLANTPGGKERTAGEFAALLASAGLQLHRIHETRSPMCVVEAVAA